MENNRFGIGESFSFGWSTVRDNLGHFLPLMLIVLPIQVALFVSERLTLNRSIGLYLSISIVGFLITAFINLAFIGIGLRFMDEEKAGIKGLFSAYPFYWRFLEALMLYLLMVLGGLLLFVFPGIILAVKYQFFGYFIVDYNMKPVEALKRSGQLTHGAKGRLFVFDLAYLGIMILGYIALIVGQLIATPLVIMAMAYVYRKLLATEAHNH